MKNLLIPFLVTMSVVLLVIFLLLLSINVNYSNWEKRFEKSIDTAYLVDESLNLEGIVNEKISKYALSNSDVENLQLKPDEVGYIVLDTLSKYNSDNFSFSKVYVIPSRYNWNICTQVSFTHNNLTPWICIDINKDNVQTAQLYVTDVRVGPFSVGKWGDMVSNINKGIDSSLLTVNENGFSGRYFENIELLDSHMIIKGSRY